MFVMDPPRLPFLVLEVIGVEFLSNRMVEALTAWFWVSTEDGSALGVESHYGRSLHAFHGYITAIADPVPGLSQLILLVIDWDG